ncbi:hypothetical protein QE401_002638 [Pseudoroseomonas cervicalis]|nr:hypothetical protein [Pseudoroseomonas cervicalis]
MAAHHPAALPRPAQDGIQRFGVELAFLGLQRRPFAFPFRHQQRGLGIEGGAIGRVGGQQVALHGGAEADAVLPRQLAQARAGGRRARRPLGHAALRPQRRQGEPGPGQADARRGAGQPMPARQRSIPGEDPPAHALPSLPTAW